MVLKRKLPDILSFEEIENILSQIDVSTPEGTRNKAILETMYSCGLRVSEAVNLKISQLYLEVGFIRVIGKGNKERIIPVSKELVRMIRDYVALKKKEFEKTDDVLLVTEKGRKMYPKYAYLLVNKVLGDSATLDKNSPHVLRHTFATHLMNQGADLNAVKELLGHSSLASTQVYTHNTIEKLKDIHRKSHPKA